MSRQLLWITCLQLRYSVDSSVEPCYLNAAPSPVSDHQLDASLGRSLQGLVALVCAPAGAVLPVDLQDLVPKAQAGQGGGRVGLHQLHKETLGEEARRGRVSPLGTD